MRWIVGCRCTDDTEMSVGGLSQAGLWVKRREREAKVRDRDAGQMTPTSFADDATDVRLMRDVS